MSAETSVRLQIVNKTIYNKQLTAITAAAKPEACAYRSREKNWGRGGEGVPAKLNNRFYASIRFYVVGLVVKFF